MRKFLSSLLLISVLIVSCSPQAQSTPEPTQTPAPPGQEIVFELKQGTFDSLKIEGTDAGNNWQKFEKNYSQEGVQIDKTEGFWWDGTVVLVFNIVNVGVRACVIDNLHEAPGSTMATILYDENQGCSGDSGTSRSLGSDQVLFEYLDAKDGLDVLGIEGCPAAMAEALLSGQVTASTVYGCGKDLVFRIAKAYNLVVKLYPTPTPEGSNPPTETPTPLPTPTSLPEQATIKLIQTSNCREGPGTGYEVVYSFPSGSEFVLIGKNGEWWLVPIDLAFTRKKSCWFYGGENIISGDLTGIPEIQPSPLPPTEASSASMPVYNFGTGQVIGSITCSEADLYEWFRYEDAPQVFYFSDELEKLYPNEVPIDNTAGTRLGVYESDAKSICGWQ